MVAKANLFGALLALIPRYAMAATPRYAAIHGNGQGHGPADEQEASQVPVAPPLVPAACKALSAVCPATERLVQEARLQRGTLTYSCRLRPYKVASHPSVESEGNS